MDQRLPRLGDADMAVAGRGHLAHPSADEEKHVRFAEALGERRIGADTEVAGVIGVLVVEQHLPPERAGNWQIEPLGKASNRLHRSFIPARSAEHHQWSRRGPKELLELRHLGQAGISLDLRPG